MTGKDERTAPSTTSPSPSSTSQGSQGGDGSQQKGEQQKSQQGKTGQEQPKAPAPSVIDGVPTLSLEIYPNEFLRGEVKE